MGVNYYLRASKPRLVFDEYHIAKVSAGWRPHFQDSEDALNAPRSEDEPQAPSYHSVADIRNLIRSGDYTIVDEEGEEAPDPEAELDAIAAWCPDGRDPSLGGGDYLDPEGYRFSRVYFL